MSENRAELLWICLSATILLMQQLPVKASGQAPVAPSSSEEVNKVLGSTWSSSRPLLGSPTEITFVIADDGKIYEPRITRFSQDDQYVAECLEAVCGLSPVHSKPSFGPYLEHFTEVFGYKRNDFGGRFDSFLKPAFDGSDVKEYLNTHPQPKNADEAFVLIHKIPLSVLIRYPGLFTKDELLSQSNLMEIKIRKWPGEEADQNGQRRSAPSYVDAIAYRYAYWGDFFRNPNLTRLSILIHAGVSDLKPSSGDFSK